MDEELQLKNKERQILELKVAKELLGLVQETSHNAINSVGTGSFKCPDTDAWARKIIALIKEHSI